MGTNSLHVNNLQSPYVVSDLSEDVLRLHVGPGQVMTVKASKEAAQFPNKSVPPSLVHQELISPADQQVLDSELHADRFDKNERANRSSECSLFSVGHALHCR